MKLFVWLLVDTNNDGEFLAKLDKLDGFPATYEKQLASKGLYMVLVYSAEDEGFVEMYATFLAAVSELRPSSKMTVTNRRPKGQVAVRWPPRYAHLSSLSVFLFHFVNKSINQ